MKIYTQTLVLSLVLALAACGDKAAEAPKTTPTQPAQRVETVAMTPEILGKKVYRRCQACHTLDEGGANRVGPNLYGVFGQVAGAKEGFTYSKAMANSGIIWTDETLSAYLENPRTYMPGNRMTFVGLRKAEDRDAVIAFMRAETGAE